MYIKRILERQFVGKKQQRLSKEKKSLHKILSSLLMCFAEGLFLIIGLWKMSGTFHSLIRMLKNSLISWKSSLASMLEAINMFGKRKMKKELIARSAVKKRRQATKGPDLNRKKSLKSPKKGSCSKLPLVFSTK